MEIHDMYNIVWYFTFPWRSIYYKSSWWNWWKWYITSRKLSVFLFAIHNNRICFRFWTEQNIYWSVFYSACVIFSVKTFLDREKVYMYVSQYKKINRENVYNIFSKEIWGRHLKIDQFISLNYALIIIL